MAINVHQPRVLIYSRLFVDPGEKGAADSPGRRGKQKKEEGNRMEKDSHAAETKLLVDDKEKAHLP